MFSNSSLGALLSTTRERLARAVETATVVSIVRRYLDRTTLVLRESALADFGRFLARAIRASDVYWWLTTPPEQEVVVIDLRDTRTIGPLVRPAQDIVSALDDAAASSRFVATGTVILARCRSAPFPELRETRTVRLLRAIFSPPDPPETADDRQEER